MLTEVCFGEEESPASMNKATACTERHNLDTGIQRTGKVALWGLCSCEITGSQ